MNCANVTSDAPGSRLVAIHTPSVASQGRSKPCRHCQPRKQSPHTTSCQGASNGLSINTLLAELRRQPVVRVGTRGNTPMLSAISGCSDPKSRPQLRKPPNITSMKLACGKSPFFGRCTPSQLRMWQSCSMLTAHSRRHTNSTKQPGPQSQPLKSRKYRLKGAKGCATSTSSGTR